MYPCLVLPPRDAPVRFCSAAILPLVSEAGRIILAIEDVGRTHGAGFLVLPELQISVVVLFELRKTGFGGKLGIHKLIPCAAQLPWPINVPLKSRLRMSCVFLTQ